MFNNLDEFLFYLLKVLNITDAGDGDLKKIFCALDLVVDNINLRYPEKSLIYYSGRRIFLTFQQSIALLIIFYSENVKPKKL